MSDRLPQGTRIRTVWVTNVRGFTQDAQNAKRFGEEGCIVGVSDSHGLCYRVIHKDGWAAWYDPTELDVISKPDFQPRPTPKTVRRKGSWLG